MVVRCRKEHHRHMLFASGMATILILQQENVKNIVSMRNTQIKYISPCMSPSPTHLSPTVITLCSSTGAMVHFCQPSSRCLTIPLQSSRASARSRAIVSREQTTSSSSRYLLGHEQPLCSLQGSSFLTASVPCCHPHQTHQPYETSQYVRIWQYQGSTTD